MHQAGCGKAEVSVSDAGRQADVEPCLPSLLPAGSREVPFIQQRRVVYGECGRSGTIYPPRVFDYLLEAVGEWYEKYLGISWIEQNIRQRGQPFLHVTCDYLRPMVTGQLISTRVTVSGLGKASITYSVAGCDEKGRQCFNAQLTACYCIEEEGALKATPFPSDMRAKITAYVEACAVGPGGHPGIGA
jgi:acyl-CoA thioesterase FadM